MLLLQNNINMLGDLKTDAFERQHHTQIQKMYGFSKTEGLFGSSRSTEMYLGGGDLWLESCVITIRQNSSNLHIKKFK